MLAAAATVELHTLIAGMFRASLNASLYQAGAHLLEEGTTLADLARWLAESESFTTLYSTGNPAAFADEISAGLLGLPRGHDFDAAAANTEFRLARDWVKSLLDAGAPPGVVACEAISALASAAADAFQDGRQRLENQAQIAQYYVVCGGQANTLEELQAVLAGVTADDRTVNQALAAIDLALGTDASLAAFPGRFSVSGTLDAHEQARVQVELVAGRTYVIQAAATSASQLDPEIVSILGVDGQVIAGWSNDDYAGREAQLTITPTADGVYTIMFGGEGGTAGSGSATLRDVTVTYGNVQWSDLALDVPLTAMIDAPFAMHEYALNLVAGEVVDISIASLVAAADPLVRPKIFKIRDPDGLVMTEASIVADEFSAATLRLTATSAGIYKIAVGDSYSDMGAYSLQTVSVSSGVRSDMREDQHAADAVAAFNTVLATDLPAGINTIGHIAPDIALTGRIDTAGDVDWVHASLNAGHRYTFNLQGAPAGKGTLADAYIEGIYGAEGEVFQGTSDDDSGVGHDAQSGFTAPATGDYYLAVRGYSRQTGTYTVSVEDNGAADRDVFGDGGAGRPGAINAWTIMVYVAADNDLEPFAILDLNEMEAASLPAGVDIAVLADRVAGYDASNGNWTDARLGVIGRDYNASTLTSSLASIGETNMGAADTLTAFIDWAVQERPAQHYALVLWNHGDGVNGVAFDESSGNDALSLREIQDAIAASIPGRVDVVGFDACSMATLEQVHALQGVTSYMVASQELEPGDGWDYASWLTDAYANGAVVDARTLAEASVASFGEQYAHQGDVTLAALALSFTDAVVAALQSFVQASAQASGSDWSAIRSAYQQATYFASSSSVDILDFSATLAGRQGVSSALAAAAAGLSLAVDNAVIATTANMSETYGLSIYWPAYRPYDFSGSYTENDIPLVGAVGWDGFLQNYWGHI